MITNIIKPYWPDHCEHLKDGNAKGIFIGSTVNQGNKHDVYIWGSYSGRGTLRYPEICIRYGEEGSEYQSLYFSIEEFINPSRAYHLYGENKRVLAHEFDGPEIDLIRGYIARNPSWKEQFK